MMVNWSNKMGTMYKIKPQRENAPVKTNAWFRAQARRIMLTNGLVSVRTLVLSLLHLFVSSALLSTWWLLTADYPSWFLLILLLPLYTQLFFRLCCAPSPSCCSLLMRLYCIRYLYCVLVTMYMVLDLAFDLLSALSLLTLLWTVCRCRSVDLSVFFCPKWC